MKTDTEKQPTTFNRRIKDVTVALTRKPRNKDQKDALIYWRVTHDKVRANYPTGLKFSEGEWKEFCNRNLGKHHDTKTSLDKYLNDVLLVAIRDLTDAGAFSIEALNLELKRGNKESATDAFKARINHLYSNNKIGNAQMYESAYNALQKFRHYKSLKDGASKEVFLQKCIEYGNVTVGENKIKVKEKDILFKQLTPQFLKDCDKFWRATGVSTSTVSMRMRCIRAIINNDDNPILTGKTYPFGKGKYLIPSSTRRQDFIPIEDIWRLEDYETDHDALMMAKDIFVFMFYGSGLNFKDLSLLKYSDITFDGELKFFREKTNKDNGDEPEPIFVPILAPMQEIIIKYGNKSHSGYIFPFLNNVNSNNEREIKRLNRRDLSVINSNLKIVAGNMGLNTEISTNWARHSYITHLISEEMLNEIVVKQMVGHSLKGNITALYNTLTPKKRKAVNSKLLNPDKTYANIIGFKKQSV